MTSLTVDAVPRAPRLTGRRFGIGLSGLAVLLLGMDAAGKLFAPAMMIANSPPLGIVADTSFYQLLGGVLAICTAFYAWPRTSPLGAILLTGYLGGAVFAHLRVGSPLFGFTLFGVYLGVLVWAGLYLRDARVRALLGA
ncbi:Polyhydroxyalkanoate depolymerase [Sphingomonas antarctica]|uniref:DoxX family protein n=1 Tax=Sphingomonas antarctica TaxID=2040274 RepID=UPI0039EB1B03